ncbi:hypothetical protein DsansV1_C19g0162581 [Dioscorea sansibarensis]
MCTGCFATIMHPIWLEYIGSRCNNMTVAVHFVCCFSAVWQVLMVLIQVLRWSLDNSFVDMQ